MTAKGRIHTIRLSKKIQKNPEYAKKIGVTANIRIQNKKNPDYKNCS